MLVLAVRTLRDRASAFVGAFVAALGLTYVTAVGRRYLQWRWLRQQAGLDR